MLNMHANFTIALEIGDGQKFANGRQRERQETYIPIRYTDFTVHSEFQSVKNLQMNVACSTNILTRFT